jgi:chromosome segregation ATPase
MPRPKGGQLKGDQLKAARQEKLEKQAIAESDTALDNLQSSFRESKAYTTQLEQQLADQVQSSTDLQSSLDASHNLINTLRAEILSLESKNSDIYHQLRMERQRHKRATSKHGSMASQILLLRKADAISSAQLSKGWRDSAATITKLLKMNEDLWTELSQSVATWSSQTEALTEAEYKLMSSDVWLKNAQKEVSKLRKGVRSATQVKERAVETAKAKVVQ